MIVILSSENSSRLRYVATQVFGQWLEQEVQFITSVDEFNKAQGIKINYTALSVQADIQMVPDTLIFEKGVSKTEPPVGNYKNVPVLFPSENTHAFGFDFFSAVFYMLSRMEEYEFTATDSFKRFTAAQSLAHRHNFLHIPVVEAWIDLLLQAIPQEKRIERPHAFKFICTIDVDNAYAIYGKPAWRQILASGRDVLTGKPGFIFKRWKIWNGKLPDPNNTYHFIEQTATRYAVPVTFFYLLGDYGQYDKNLTWNSKEMRQVVLENISWSVSGIHPSFNSGLKPEIIQKETQRLRELAGMRINTSRQHYLKCFFPHTFRHLEAAGIRNDFTLGFHDLPGYRAGTGRAFYFYDVLTETETQLALQPFVLMDGTLHDYMKLGPDAAYKKTEEIFATARQYGTPVCTLWHNDTVNDIGAWRGWQRIFLLQFNLSER